MSSPVADRLADDVIHHRPGGIAALIAHAKALEGATNAGIGGDRPRSVAEEAEFLIGGPRRDDYGPAEDGFAHVARLWAPILGLDSIEPRLVAACMVAWKMSRALTGAAKRDNYVDLVGYALLWEQIDRPDTPATPGDS